jgi:prepilin-type N-terminal cleavage/methylation domain-containing protein
MLYRRRLDLGFTIVELVCTLALVGVLMAAASTQFLDTKSFDERITTDSILSLVRTAQQLGFSRSAVDLSFQDTGSEIKVAARVGGVEQASRTFPKSEVTITVDGTSTGGSPGVCSSLTSPITLQFDSNAELSGAYPSGNYNQGFPICLNGNTPNLCISPAGFAHLGACV